MPTPSPRRLTPLLATALLGLLGCADPDQADGLYVFNGATRTVMVWGGLDELHEAAKANREPPKPARTLKSNDLSGITLAWGGMAMDTVHKRLYLVTDRGTVHVILRPDTQKGELKHRDDIFSFKLKNSSSGDFPGDSWFGQASVDTANDILYVVENAREAARVWHVPHASRLTDGATVASQGNTSRIGEDRWGAGVAAGPSHRFYALFGEGDRTNDGHDQGTDGPRLRQGQHQGPNPAFTARNGNRDSNLLAGPATLLPSPLRYGALAYDDRHHCLYVLAGPQPEADPVKIRVFGTGQFHGALDQAPSRSLTHVPRDLRIIVHPAHADWLAGAGSTAPANQGRETGKATLYLWKAPSEDGEPVKLTTLAPGAEIRGIAFGGH